MATREKQGESFLNQTPARSQDTAEVEAGRRLQHGPDNTLSPDPWRHRNVSMRCKTCMFFVAKVTVESPGRETESTLGRCRRRAPTMNGYPVVFLTDWCGDHKLDENK